MKSKLLMSFILFSTSFVALKALETEQNIKSITPEQGQMTEKQDIKSETQEKTAQEQGQTPEKQDLKEQSGQEQMAQEQEKLGHRQRIINAFKGKFSGEGKKGEIRNALKEALKATLMKYGPKLQEEFNKVVDQELAKQAQS